MPDPKQAPPHGGPSTIDPLLNDCTDPTTTEPVRLAEHLTACTAELEETTRCLQAENVRRRRAESAYSALVGNSLQALIIIQGERLSFTNQIFLELTGYSDAELKTMSREELLNLVHPDDRPSFDRIWRSPEPDARFEARAIRKDGTIFWVEVFASLIRYNDDDAIQAAIIDITARKVAEDALREMNAWHRAVIDLSPDLIIVHVAGRIVQANKAAADFLGIASSDQVIGRPVLDFPAPGTQEIHRDRYRRLTSGNPIGPMVAQIANSDGTIKYLEIYPTLTQFQGQQAVLIVGHDVTEKQLARRALQQAHTELEQRVTERTAELAIANAGLLSQISARERVETELRRTNAELQALYSVANRPPHPGNLEAVVHTVLDQMWVLIKPQVAWVHVVNSTPPINASRGLDEEPSGSLGTYQKAIEQINAEVLTTGTLKLELCTEGPAAFADPPKFRVVATPIRYGRHKVGVIGILSPENDTYHRQFTRQDLRFVQSLTHQVSMMIETGHIAETQAEIKLLRKVDRLRSELIANFSHDLKTPLGVIKFSSTTLMRDDVDFDRDMHRELLSDIAAQTDHLSRIVEQILELGKLESDSLKLRLEPTDLSEVCTRAVRAIRHRSSKHELQIDFAPPRIIVNADPLRVCEVFNNLLDNALNYSPDGGPIRIQGRIAKDHALVTIADEGIGIPKAEIRRVFERFYRGSGDASIPINGAGLGLPVCRGIVEAHGGKIWVDSRPGEGTTVSFTLPTSVSQTEVSP